jgi:hypothetical protein
MRRTSKLGRVVEVPAVVSGLRLFEIVEKEFYIPAEQQIIFWRGSRIEDSGDTRLQTFTLAERDVVHVHNHEIVQREVTCIYLQFLNADLIKYRETRVEASSSEVILNALEDSLMYEVEDIEKFLYAQSSRYINLNYSFLREAIEDDSIIIAVPRRGGREVTLSSLEQREIEILESRMKLTRKTSLHQINAESDTHDFKKKPRCNVYKSMILPGSKELVWREDNNTAEVPRKVLARRLTKARLKNIDEVEEVKEEEFKDEEDNYDSREKRSLKSSNRNNVGNPLERNRLEEVGERKRDKDKDKPLLFNSESLKRRCDVRRLKPPRIGNDTFEEMDDAEERESEDGSLSTTGKAGEITPILYKALSACLPPKSDFEGGQVMEI